MATSIGKKGFRRLANYFPGDIIRLHKGTGKRVRPDQLEFRAPVTMGKFDMREYLRAVYSLPVKKVNSMVYEGRIKRRTLFKNTGGRNPAQYFRLEKTRQFKKFIVTVDVDALEGEGSRELEDKASS